MRSEFSLFYTTCPDSETAKALSRTLLEEKLIACSNLLPGMESQYWWEGKIESAKECVLILKSKSSLKAKLQARFIELHPYDIPCFLEMTVESGNLVYFDWLRESLK